MADKLGSYELAYLQLGVTPEQVVTDSIAEYDDQPLPPIAVSLADRARALEDIMRYLNKASQTRGSKAQLPYSNSDFNQRYGAKAGEVQRGAETKRDQLLVKFRTGIATLIAADALRAHGYDEDDIELAYVQMQAGINKVFGVGRSNARQRAAMVQNASRSAANDQNG